MSGSLVTMGFGLIFVSALFEWFLHHMFIVGFQSPMALLFLLLFPIFLVAAGAGVAMVAIRGAEALRTWRTAIGTLLVLAPLLVLAAMLQFGVLLGSLGMDIHWNASKALGYAAVLCIGVTLCLCFILGIRLLRNANAGALVL
ncbi:MAG TPA: hypothetical protein VGM02_07150 [Acidobacteriaceae bacterium]|jgi:hypothetical protein